MLLALFLAAAAIVLCVVLVIRSGGDEKPSGSDAVPIHLSADVNSLTLVNGEKVTMNMTVGEVGLLAMPERADITQITFTSDNPGVVRVDSGGRVDALQTGSAKIIATAVGFNAICECSVASAPVNSAEKDQPITTAITANEDVLARNAAKSPDELYSITVNRRTNVVTVYTYDQDGKYTVPVRAMVCSCGAGGEDTTPTGSYAIYLREEWLGLNGDVYGLYVSGIWEDYLFHSVPYYTMDHGDLETEEFNKLGANASQGCVRMMIADVLWIYENCPIYTPVEIVDSDASVDVLGKPAAVKIDERIGWDPTDPDRANPYRGKTPEITGAVDVTIARGGNYNPMVGVSATDICGNDITDRVEIKGNVLSEKSGVYYLTYTVTDDFHLTTEVTCVVIVE